METYMDFLHSLPFPTPRRIAATGVRAQQMKANFLSRTGREKFEATTLPPPPPPTQEQHLGFSR